MVHDYTAYRTQRSTCEHSKEKANALVRSQFELNNYVVGRIEGEPSKKAPDLAVVLTDRVGDARAGGADTTEGRAAAASADTHE